MIKTIKALIVFSSVMLVAIRPLRAQTTVSVSSEVRQDILQRLATAKNWVVPKFVERNGAVRTRCNGAGGNLSGGITPAQACSMIYTTSPQTIDDYMAEFKACAMDTAFFLLRKPNQPFRSYRAT